jgi:hypothetical protein
MFGVGVGIRVGGFTPSSGGGGLNPDAQAFITATGITNPTEISAINTLVNDLQGYGLWSKMKAIYPFVGGTSTTCKYNLKDPRDLDAAFRLVFNGGWTFASTGATPNGTNGYADTKLNSFTNLTQTSISFGIYYRTVVGGTPIEGTYTGDALSISPRGTDTYFSVGAYAVIGISDTSLGFKAVSRNGSSVKSYINSTQIGSGTSANDCPNLTIYLGALNFNGSSGFYSSNQEAFAFIGDGLTDTEASNFYTAVQAFQTTLGRQV